MAALQQNANGTWTITKLTHDLDDNVSLPLKLWYNGGSVVSAIATIKNNTSIQTKWVTEIGVEIDTTKITWSSTPVFSDDGTRKYLVTAVTWDDVSTYDDENDPSGESTVTEVVKTDVVSDVEQEVIEEEGTVTKKVDIVGDIENKDTATNIGVPVIGIATQNE